MVSCLILTYLNPKIFKKKDECDFNKRKINRKSILRKISIKTWQFNYELNTIESIRISNELLSHSIQHFANAIFHIFQFLCPTISKSNTKNKSKILNFPILCHKQVNHFIFSEKKNKTKTNKILKHFYFVVFASTIIIDLSVWNRILITWIYWVLIRQTE